MRENTNKTLRPLAANLRRCMTDAENRLWYHLRNRRFHGIRFNRQAVIGGDIVDFLNREHKIIIKVDGAQHQEQQTYDAARSTHLQQQGYRVIRFWNHDVLTQTETVLAVIYEAIRNPSPAAPSLASKGRETVVTTRLCSSSTLRFRQPTPSPQHKGKTYGRTQHPPHPHR